jgi:threonylcarbamoyladenosine tRNA methylthiotransferase MtaB
VRTFFIENFGCRASQADGAALNSHLTDSGLEPIAERSRADLIVINTCTVTASADADARSTVRRAHRENPDARILVTGCYAQRAPEEIAELPGVQWVVGNSHKHTIASLVGDASYHGGVNPGGIHAGDIFAERSVFSPWRVDASADHARPNLKIQDGCNNRCSFCVIPFVRGSSRFISADEVVSSVRGLSERYREVVLTGINLGRWGREAESSMRLPDLLRRLVAETAIERIRLSSVEPMDWSDDLIALMAGSERIAPHVHMPLQSGSDAILRAMHRKYRPRHYADRLSKAHQAMPDAAIGADVMTGFPGETDALLEESVRFIEQLPFTYLHVFTYSERPGTKAVGLDGLVPVSVRRERTARLRALSDRMNREFRERMIGRTLSAVTLEQRGLALTENFVHVEIGNWCGPNRVVGVMPVALTSTGMREHSVLPVL